MAQIDSSILCLKTKSGGFQFPCFKNISIFGGFWNFLKNFKVLVFLRNWTFLSKLQTVYYTVSSAERPPLQLLVTQITGKFPVQTSHRNSAIESALDACANRKEENDWKRYESELTMRWFVKSSRGSRAQWMATIQWSDKIFPIFWYLLVRRFSCFIHFVNIAMRSLLKPKISQFLRWISIGDSLLKNEYSWKFQAKTAMLLSSW